MRRNKSEQEPSISRNKGEFSSESPPGVGEKEGAENNDPFRAREEEKLESSGPSKPGSSRRYLGLERFLWHRRR